MKEIIIFSVSGRYYGVEVRGLQGIENYMQPTGVADCPDYVEGIVSIRKNIYPVLDIASKFSLPKMPITDDTKLLILSTNGGPLACLVDDVNEMHVAKDEDVKPVPAMLRTDKTRYAECIVRTGDKLVIVIEPEKLFSEAEAKVISKVAENAE